MSYSTDDAMLVTYPLARSTYEYLMRMKDLGAIEGALGQMTLIPALQPIIEAIHTVLAGGAIEITTTQRGSPDIVNELRQRFAQGQTDGNFINVKSGYYVTIGPP